jgi:hypothetical protein
MLAFAFALVLSLLASPVLAVDGVLEINQTCALETGCFPGDSPGFPVTIDRDQPGSYRLTSSLFNADQDTSAILISDDHVAVDLNGFAVNGPATCQNAGANLLCAPSGSGAGVATSPTQGRTGVVVRNGIVRGMASDGISLGFEAWVDDVLVVSNVGTGIAVGDRSLITDCRVERNLGGGISAAASSLVEGNSVADGRDLGILIRDGAVVSRNIISNNGGTGIDSATSSSGGTLLIDNAVQSNGNGGSLHVADGYTRNVLDGNASNLNTDQVSGGIQLGMGTNLCVGAACP